MDDLIAAIKAKKELQGLDDAFIKQRIEKIFSGNRKLQEKYGSTPFTQFQRSKEYKDILKHIRKELRAIYGVFQEGPRSPGDDTESILESHTSTKERLPFYGQMYKELAARIPSPKTLLDLGCGMNPLSYPYMRKHGWHPQIVASDISANDMEFLSEAFLAHGIPGKTLALDLTKDYALISSIDADVTFLLKLLDSLEEAHRHISYQIFEHLTSEWIIVSFPTKSLGGKKRISAKGRSWFERLLHRKELHWENFSLENELFYVIRRSGA